MDETHELAATFASARRRRGDEFACIRAEVRAAAGEWVLVHEERGTTKRGRRVIRSRFYGVTRVGGYTQSGFFLRAVTAEDRSFRVYLRFLAAKVVANVQ